MVISLLYCLSAHSSDNLLKGKLRTAKGSEDNAKIPKAKFLHPVIGEVRLDADNVHEKCPYVG